MFLELFNDFTRFTVFTHGIASIFFLYVGGGREIREKREIVRNSLNYPALQFHNAREMA